MRRWLRRFNAVGIDGSGNQPGAGRKQRVGEAERSRIIALAGQDFAGPDRIAHATQVATARLDSRAGRGSGDGPSPDHALTAGALYTL